MAPKTLNRFISSLSSFCKYLAGYAADFRLPILVPNPAEAQFIVRAKSDPVDETRALSATRARQLVGMPAGDSVIDFRDRAILKFSFTTIPAVIRPRARRISRSPAGSVRPAR
jgi:site-specific recombinase XerC